jgi:hypothetical protein
VLKHQLECTLYFTYIDCFGPPFLEQDTYQMSFEGFKEKIKDDFKVIDFLNNDDNYFLCLKRFLDNNFTILPVEEPIYVRPNECIIKRSIYVQSDEHLQVNINNKVYKTKDII